MFDLMLAHTDPREMVNDTLRRFGRVGVAPAAAAVMERELPVPDALDLEPSPLDFAADALRNELMAGHGADPDYYKRAFRVALSAYNRALEQ